MIKNQQQIAFDGDIMLTEMSSVFNEEILFSYNAKR